MALDTPTKPPRAPVTNARWRATINYRTQNGPVDVEHQLLELEELQEIVEQGPHWDTIIDIKIVRVSHVTDPNLTVERAKEI